jgi:hypothetical protein
MAPDTTVASESVADRAEVMASVDTEGSARRLVIADVSTDDAWISMPESESVRVPAWE